MALRWKAYAPNTILKAVEVQDLADNGVIQLDTAADLASADLVNANVVYVVAEAKPYVRQAAGVGADKWQVFSGGLTGLGGWADITATTGSPTKHDYTDSDGNDWTAYEFTGDGTVTTDGGVVEALLVGGGASAYGTGPQGDAQTQGQPGNVWLGLAKMNAGAQVVHVGNAGTVNGAGNSVGQSSRLFDYETGIVTWGHMGTGRGATQYNDSRGITSSITGTAKEYASGHPKNPDNPGRAGDGPNPGTRGVVIVRVPRSNAKA